jgi:hypothetical protein
VFVERGFADSDVGDHLVDSDATETVAIKTTDRRLDKSLTSWSFHGVSRNSGWVYLEST